MTFKHFIAIFVLFSAVLSTVIGENAVPKWKLLFRVYRNWTGYYQFYNRPHACNVQVHSVQDNKDGTAYITFKTEGVTMDLNAFSDDDIVVTMKKSTSYNNSDRFPVDQDFKTDGVFRLEGRVWQYIANITEPKDKGFQTLHLHAMSNPDDEDSVTPSKKDRSLSLGLAVGIPVTLAIILMITGIGIGIWAIRKGYLRHVPRAYKNFRNQAETPVSYEKDEPTNVHI